MDVLYCGRRQLMTKPNVDLRIGTKEFALGIIRTYQALPATGEAQVLGKQVLRSGTSNEDNAK